MTDSTEQFAFGADTVKGCECPAKDAGYDVSSREVIRVAELYDQILKDRLDTPDPGTVPKDVAADAWREAIAGAREVRDGDRERYDQYISAIRQANIVRRRVFNEAV